MTTPRSSKLRTLTLGRAFRSSKYEESLAEYSDSFAKHRESIRLALLMHTTHGVDNANLGLSRVENEIRGLGEKLNMLLVFKQLDSPRERELKEYVKARGGSEDDGTLQDMISLYRKSDPGLADGSSIPTLAEIRKELAEDWEESLARNLVAFKEALKEQEAKIVFEVQGIVNLQTDKIIGHLDSRPHDQIHDLVYHLPLIVAQTNQFYFKDLREIWKNEVGRLSSV